MIIVVISDINGLNTISDDLLKKVTLAHDLLFINIEDASMFGSSIYDLDSETNIPKLISKNKKLKEIENTTRSEIVNSNFKRLEKYRVTGVSITSKKEVVTKIIDLLERHKHAVGR